MSRPVLRLHDGRCGGKLNKLSILTPVFHFHGDDDRQIVSVFLRWLKAPSSHGEFRFLVCLFVRPANHLGVADAAFITYHGHHCHGASKLRIRSRRSSWR